MTLTDPLPPPLAYGAACYASGADGKTLLVGHAGGVPLFAIAAGLGGAPDRERFAVLARYLLRRDRADGYWLLLPADLGGAEQLVLEQCVDGRRDLLAASVQRDDDDRFAGLGGAAPLNTAPPLGDLLDGGQSLAGVMRRELDGLAEALALPLP
jgi:hypothetical protein